MNNRGQVIFFTFMLGLTILVFALALAFPVKEAVDNARNSTQLTNFTYINESVGGSGGSEVNGTIEFQGMDCNNSSISSFNKGACVVSDLSMFYFIGGLIFLVGSILAARVLL